MEYFWYSLAFYGWGNDGCGDCKMKWNSTIIKLEHNRITKKNIEEAKIEACILVGQLMSCNYLGLMTEDQFNDG